MNEMMRLIFLIATISVAGCSALPSAGPRASEVRDPAAQDSAAMSYAVVSVNQQVIDTLKSRVSDASLTSFNRSRGASDIRVGVGDTLAVTIWEAGSGGLFSAALSDRQAPGAREATIPEQLVGRDGYITVPYAGRVHVAGRRTVDIQRSIEHALDGKAIQPQALVNITKPVSNTVTVVGEGAAGARVSLSPKGDRILDVIAAAGGMRSTVNDSFVQLSRGSRTARVAMTKIASNPSENVYLQPGDVLTVLRDPQMFYAVGALGRNLDIPFDAEGLTLSQALAKAGGLLDYRADPAGVFVFRLERPTIAQRLVDVTPQMTASGGRVRVVYSFDLSEAAGLFAAGQFKIFNRDIVYVSNAKLSDVQKVVHLFTLAASPVANGASIANRFQ